VRSSCKECSEIVRKECVDKGPEFISKISGDIPLFSFPQRCRGSTEAVQGVHRLVESSELINQREELEDCYCRRVHRVKRIKYLEVFEVLPQGVRAGVFLKTQDCKESSGGLVPLR
jgi:hypothetical protein